MTYYLNRTYIQPLIYLKYCQITYYNYQNYSLGQYSIVTKKHYEHSKSHKEKHLVGAFSQFQMSSSLSSWQEAQKYTGRHDAGE